MKKLSIMNKSVWLIYFLYSRKIPFYPRLLQQINRIIFAHSGFGYVVHSNGVIGDNCQLPQNITIGDRGIKGIPIIGNNVFKGTGATILGQVIMGDNAKIVAMSLVQDNVSPHITVVGIPAKGVNK